MAAFLIFVTVFMHLVLPLIFLMWIFKGKLDSKVFLFSLYLMTGAYLLFMGLLGAGWGWVGVFWPWVFGALFLGLVGLQMKNGLPETRFPKRWSGPFFGTGINLVLATLFLLGIPNFFNARDYQGEALELTFPLTDGAFYIAHGGANESVNYHFPVTAQKYALDIMELNSFGTRATGFLPDGPEEYQIFGNAVVAPCSGEVIAAKGSLKDQNAMIMDPENLAGNFIILFCQEHSVLLAHLQLDSVMVLVGDVVTSGQPLASAGNTGNTSEPHLHIHAVRGRHIEQDDIAFKAEGVPMTFDGRFPIRGDTIDN